MGQIMNSNNPISGQENCPRDYLFNLKAPPPQGQLGPNLALFNI